MEISNQTAWGLVGDDVVKKEKRTLEGETGRRSGKVDRDTITWLPSRIQMDVFASGFHLSSKLKGIMSAIDSPNLSWQLHMITYQRGATHHQRRNQIFLRPTASYTYRKMTAVSMEVDGFWREGALLECGFEKDQRIPG